MDPEVVLQDANYLDNAKCFLNSVKAGFSNFNSKCDK